LGAVAQRENATASGQRKHTDRSLVVPQLLPPHDDQSETRGGAKRRHAQFERDGPRPVTRSKSVERRSSARTLRCEDGRRGCPAGHHDRLTAGRRDVVTALQSGCVFENDGGRHGVDRVVECGCDAVSVFVI
jgi:hypothetical protein